MPPANHLQLDRVVFYGRPLSEYERFFDLDLGQLKGRSVLDCPSGASSFCAEAALQGIRVIAVDPFFSAPADQLRALGEADIDHVLTEVAKTPDHYAAGYAGLDEMRSIRQRSLHLLCDDVASHPASGRYVSALLPHLPFADGQFDLVLSGHFLFIYDDRFDYDFHLAAVRELARVSSGEVRIFPPRGMNRQPYPHLDRLRRELEWHGVGSEVRRIDFEAVTGWNELLVLQKTRGARPLPRRDAIMTSHDYIHELSQRYFDGALSPEFMLGFDDLPGERADVRAFIERAFRLMVAGGFTARDLSEVQGAVLGSLVARILPGGWEGRVPPITLGGRHRQIDRYIALNHWRPANSAGRLLDLGCGFPPLTTIDTADYLETWTVHGMDPSLPTYVVHDSDNNYATFDANKRIVYFQPAAPSPQSWTALLADTNATRARFAALFFDLTQRAPERSGPGNRLEPAGARLLTDPLRAHERNGLSFSVGGIGSPVGGEYDVVRCFNVLMYFDDAFRTRALDWFVGIIREGGLLVTGSNWAFSTESRYFVFQKEEGRLRLREFAFSVDNLCPVAILPWYTTADDDRELATLTPLLRTLRTNRAFKRQLDATVDGLRAQIGVCPRLGNGCYGRLDPKLSPTEAWAGAAEISDRMVEAGLVDAAVAILERAGHRAYRNEVGHIAVQPPL